MSSIIEGVELSYLFLALILSLPVLVLVIMTKIKEMHKDTLQFLRDTQVVGGEPRALVETRQTLQAEQVRDARDRQAYISEHLKARAMQNLG